MYLRMYKPGDLPALFALDRVCFDPPFRFSRSAMRKFAEAPNALVQLACKDIVDSEPEDLLGFVILHLENTGTQLVGYVVTLDVAPACRRQGIAEALMGSLEVTCLRAGAGALSLHVFHQNTGAVRLYERLGFVYEQMAGDFYGPGLDALIYHKPLSRNQGHPAEGQSARGEFGEDEETSPGTSRSEAS
ncbi:MAG: GNAT family N-acetyltransferase [Janthinobacterium lividum]